MIKDILNSEFSRREFLKGTLAATAAVTGLQFAAGEKSNALAESVSPVEHMPFFDNDEGGRWVPAACWHNCGGRCVNKVLIKDGIVVRQKTDDSHPDSPDYPQQRGCVRGKAQQQQCFGADRLKYPMKRKHWSPEEPHGEPRGRDEWERISWDEAISYVAEQYRTIREKYGNEAFLQGSWGSFPENIPLLHFGGHTSTTDSTSYGTFLTQTDSTIGLSVDSAKANNDRFDMLNAETVVFLSVNPAWSKPGTPMLHFLRAKENGTKFICIDPMYSASAQALDADWVPVRTGTDTALLLGVASEMLRLDTEEGNIIDWDFLKKYTVGFDAGSGKAPNLKEDVNFRDYLEGRYDGVAKTAAWASRLCGTPVEQITMLARALSKEKNVWFLHGFAVARNAGSENIPQLVMTLGTMGGHIGKPGNCVGMIYASEAGNGGPRLVNAGATGVPWPSNPVEGIIPGPQVWDAVLTGKYRMIGDFYGFAPFPLTEGKEMTCNIHCITNMDEHAYLQTGPNMKKGIEAFRKVDFVVSKAQFLNTNAVYSDIVLPVTTYWERPGGLAASNREFLYCYSQVTEPLYEAKTDQEIDCLIMEALGLDPKEAYPCSEEQQFFNAIAGSTVVDTDKAEDDGSLAYIPLVTITEQDIRDLGVEGTPQEGIVSLHDFLENGGYQVPRRPDDAFSAFLGYGDYIRDPEANPLPTASGKFEITSQTKADFLNGFGFTDWDYKPYPEYLVPGVGYETTFRDGDIDGEKGDYPYLMCNIHYLRSAHSSLDNCPWLRESWARPVFISAADAAEKGIADGDTVLISTGSGKSLRKACVMEGLIPGVVSLSHGAWVHVDEESGIDLAGADNYLTGSDISGSGVTPYNNLNCNIEKYDGPALPADVDTDSRILEL